MISTIDIFPKGFFDIIKCFIRFAYADSEFKNTFFIFSSLAGVSLKSDFTLLEGTLTTMMTYDFRENRSFNVPVLFVFGEEDFSCPTGMLEDCFDGISAPVKKLEIIPKAAHSCFFDQPEIFNQRISDFLNDINP